jgi:hypothetical protein
MTCVFGIDVDTIIWLFVCADVGPRGCEVELLRASARQELGRPPWGGPRVGERRRREDVEVRPAEDERAVRRHRFDDPGVGPSHAPPADAGADFEDISPAWRWCYRVCLRACGRVSRMRASWSSVWEFRHRGGPWCDEQQ